MEEKQENKTQNTNSTENGYSDSVFRCWRGRCKFFCRRFWHRRFSRLGLMFRHGRGRNNR